MDLGLTVLKPSQHYPIPPTGHSPLETLVLFCIVESCHFGVPRWGGLNIKGKILCMYHASLTGQVSKADLSKQGLGKSLSLATTNQSIYGARPCPVQGDVELRHQSPWDKWC